MYWQPMLFTFIATTTRSTAKAALLLLLPLLLLPTSTACLHSTATTTTGIARASPSGVCLSQSLQASTIHKFKGLEKDAIVVMGLDAYAEKVGDVMDLFNLFYGHVAMCVCVCFFVFLLL
jgi:hypothetical protein